MWARLALVGALGVLVVASVRTEPLRDSAAQSLPASATPTLTLTATATVTQTATATATRTPTGTSTPTATATHGASVTPTATATLTPTQRPTSTSTTAATQTPTSTPTATPTQTPTPSPTPARTPTSAPTASPTSRPAGSGSAGVVPLADSVPAASPVVVAPPALGALSASSVTRNSATITWTTSGPATSQVEYGIDPASSIRSPVNASLVNEHRVVLSGLRPTTTYHVTARSVSPQGGLSVSPDLVFTTGMATLGPDLSSLVVQRVTATTAQVAWTTPNGMVAQVEYGADVNYGSSTLLKVFAQSSQQMSLTGLAPGATYHVRVKSWDASGNLSASDDVTFATAIPGPATLLGGTVVQPIPMTLPAGQAAAYPFTATHSGQADVARIFVDAGTTTAVIRVGLYADRDGAPDALLAQGSAPGLSSGWKVVGLPPVGLVQGQQYWVIAMAPFGNGGVVLRDAGPATSGWVNVLSKATTLAALPAVWTTGPLAARGALSASVEQLAPTVTLLDGADDGSAVTGRLPLSVVVDDDVAIARVQFFVDGVPLGPPQFAGPYSVVWDTSSASPVVPHTVSVSATDVLGRTGTSAAITVQVQVAPAFAVD